MTGTTKTVRATIEGSLKHKFERLKGIFGVPRDTDAVKVIISRCYRYVTGSEEL